MSDEGHEQEIRRWQDAIRDLLIRLTGAPDSKIDGGGCESGDPLDLTLTEIEMAISWLKDEASPNVSLSDQGVSIYLTHSSGCVNNAANGGAP